MGKKRSFGRGNKFFELSNHLGNVLAVISDRKLPIASSGNANLVASYQPIVLQAQDYYAFGMIMPQRSYTAPGSGYRYGFNGKENDNEVKGVAGSQQDYGMRIYDPRVGRFLSVDPITKDYPMLTPYQFASNRPIDGIDLDGLEYFTPQTAKVTPLVTYDPLLKRITSIDILLNYQNIANGLKAKVHEKFKLRGSYYDDDVTSGIILVSLKFETTEKPRDLNDGLATVEGDNGVFEVRFSRALKSTRLAKRTPTRTEAISNTQGKSKADKASAVIEIVSFGLDKLYDWFEENVEIPRIESQVRFVQKSLAALITNAIESNLIPAAYLNTESLTAIAEYIVSGELPKTRRPSGNIEVDQNLLDISRRIWSIVENNRERRNQGKPAVKLNSQKVDNTKITN